MKKIGIVPAAKLDAELKLLACANVKGENIEAFACPMIVPHTNPISHISDVYNGISLTSDVTGDIMYYGRGAGRYPTAGAVMSDVVAVLSGAASCEYVPVFEKKAGSVKNFDEIAFTYYIRAEIGKSELTEVLTHAADTVEVLSDANGITEVKAGKMTRPELEKALCGVKVLSVIRITE